MNRNRILYLLAVLLSTMLVGRTQQVNRPNIVILLADDLGYADLSCYGSKVVQTPAIDKLAEQGMRFTDFYAASPVCSPSRAALMTGRFSLRTGVYSWIHPSQKMHLPQEEVTIAELLKQVGYKTAHMGKWHLSYDLLEGATTRPHPQLQGFDYWMATGNNAAPSHHNPNNFIRNGKPLGELQGYSSQLVADEAIEWLDKNAGGTQPFFLNLWFHEPHFPNAAPPELMQKYSKTPLPAYYGSIENMDTHIGRVLKKLDDLNVASHTLVIFISDNGSDKVKEGSNGVLKAGKTTLWEGGIRVPAIMRWPGQIRPRTVSTTPAGLVDVVPTVCALTGAAFPQERKIDGESLVALFEGRPLVRAQPLYWFYSPSRPVCVIRDGRWSLVADPVLELPRKNLFQEAWIGLIKETGLVNFRLYNMEEDPGQTADLAAKYPEIFEMMKRKMRDLHTEVMQEAVDWRSY